MPRDAREVAGLVLMPSLLAALGFGVKERTQRAVCLLHAGGGQGHAGDHPGGSRGDQPWDGAGRGFIHDGLHHSRLGENAT